MDTYGVTVTNGALQTRIGTNADGVADAAERNVISGNQSGILVWDWSSMNVYLANEFIAGDAGGLVASGTLTQADVFQSNDTESTTSGDWSYENTLPGGWATYNAYRATGTLNVSTESIYTFALTSDDGGQLKINGALVAADYYGQSGTCLLYTSPSPRDLSTSRMPSSA